jgi:hypothetical protein
MGVAGEMVAAMLTAVPWVTEVGVTAMVVVLGWFPPVSVNEAAAETEDW